MRPAQPRSHHDSSPHPRRQAGGRARPFVGLALGCLAALTCLAAANVQSAPPTNAPPAIKTVARPLPPGPVPPAVSLQDSLRPSPIHALRPGTVTLVGHTTTTTTGPALTNRTDSVRLRVTTSLGQTHETRVTPVAGRFSARFPQDFPGATLRQPQLLYVDATDAADWSGPELLAHQAEALIVVADQAPPDLPLAFLDDFIDDAGRKDAASAQWPLHRLAVERFRQGRAARLMGLHDPGFRLDAPEGFAWFKDHAALYDFDHRDRDWSTPLGHRVARGFWQAVWNRWFNASNNHPWDGNPANRSPANFRPYTFANDAADLLVLLRLLRHATPRVADHRGPLAEEVFANLLALQHRGTNSFALPEPGGAREHYTAGAFRYGMFETGEWLTEGKGWFNNPRFRDFVRGGVFNGRAVWAIGESLQANPRGPAAARASDALTLTLRFCLHDGLAHRYTRRLPSGLLLWNAPAGEHGYLLLGALAAAAALPDLPVTLDPAQPPQPLHAVCANGLDALVEIARRDGTWSRYPNADAVNITALATGARTLASHPNAPRWREAASRAARLWMSLQPDPSERPQPTPHFGYRPERSPRQESKPAPEFTSFRLGDDRHPHIPLYIGGHWIHALAAVHAVTGDPAFSRRAHALLAYYCGDNPLHVRLLNELGAIPNRVTDTDGDGWEETLRWDAYPESTAFVQIGLFHLLAHSTPPPAFTP